MSTAAAPSFLGSSVPQNSPDSKMLVTMRVDQQLFGIPVQHVQDVLREQKVAHVPLSPPEIAGSLNLRGRIVTVINLRERLKLQRQGEKKPSMFVVVEHKNEYYSLMVDAVGEVLTIPADDIEKSPANLAENWRNVASGIHRLKDELLVIVDIRALLTL